MSKEQLLQNCQDILICFQAERLVKLPLTIFPSCHCKASVHCAKFTNLGAKNFTKSDKSMAESKRVKLSPFNSSMTEDSLFLIESLGSER